MLILGLLGMYFDAAVVKVLTFLLLFRLALAILCRPNVHLIEKSEWFNLPNFELQILSLLAHK